MTAPDSLPLHALAEDNLAAADSDLLRAVIKTFADALMSAGVDAACNAERGQVSDERVKDSGTPALSCPPSNTLHGREPQPLRAVPPPPLSPPPCAHPHPTAIGAHGQPSGGQHRQHPIQLSSSDAKVTHSARQIA